MMTYEATVPMGVYPGMKFAAILGGQHMVLHAFHQPGAFRRTSYQTGPTSTTTRICSSTGRQVTDAV